jgi:hypothetical protein
MKMRQLFPTARDVDPIGWILGEGFPLAPPQTLELSHVLEADSYLFVRYRRT